jgi:predicted Zn-dependent protease
LVYGQDPRQGYVESNVFYHPEMKFKYPVPTGWKLENSPIQVQMAPEDGNAMIIFTLAKQKTPEEAAQATITDLNLTALENKKVLVNGLPAVALLSQQVSKNEQTGTEQVLKVLSYFIAYNNSVYVFHGVAADANFNNYRNSFETTMANFAPLTEASKLNVRPTRIKIQTVRNTGTLNDAFQYFNVPQSQRKELAFLNNLELSDPVEQGKLIKIFGD